MPENVGGKNNTLVFKTLGILGNPSPLHSRFPLGFVLRKSFGSSVRDGFPILSSSGLKISFDPQVLGNLSAVGDGFPNISLVLVEYGYNAMFLLAVHNSSIGDLVTD